MARHSSSYERDAREERDDQDEREGNGPRGGRLAAVVPLISYPGRLTVLLLLATAPWLMGALSGWARFGLSAAALVALALWFLEVALTRSRRMIMPLSVLPILLGVGLGVLQIWPLPLELQERLGAGHARQQWESLGGMADIDRQIAERAEVHTSIPATAAELPANLPISIDPQATGLMTLQLFTAAIIYLLAAHYFHQPRSLLWFCLLLTLNGVAMSAFGIVQKLTGPDNQMFLGSLEVGGTVFGSYVNRNNAAGWLLMSMSAAVMLVLTAFGGSDEEDNDEDWLASSTQPGFDLWQGVLRLVHDLDAKKIASVFALVFIVGGVLTTLSRGGTLGMILGSIIGFLVIGVNSSSRGKQGLQFLVVAVGLGLLLVGWLGFGQKLMDRFDQADKSDVLSDTRVQGWTDTWPLFSEQWLVGSGLNTYQHVHRPLRTTPELATYVFAENQFYQTLIDGGLIGGLLLLGMLAWSMLQVSYLVQRARNRAMLAAGALGAVALGAEGVSAFFDFGLFLPANTFTFAALMGAVAGQAQFHARRVEDAPIWANWGWGRAGSLLLLLLLGGGLIGVLQHYRLGQVEDALLAARQIREQEMSAEGAEIDASIARLAALAADGTEANLHDSLGQQWQLRYRWQEYQKRIVGSTRELTDAIRDAVWQSTALSSRAATLRQARVVSPASAEAMERDLWGNEAARQSLLSAYAHYLRSRRSNPFRPELHLRLADLGRLLSSLSPEPHLDRAVQIAPTNPRYQLLVGLQKLEACNFDEAAESFAAGLEHLRRALALDANATRVLEPLVLQKTVLGIEVDGLEPARYARGLLLDRPDLLLDFVGRNPEIKSQPEVRLQLLRECQERLSNREQGFNYSVVETWAMGRIEMELGNWQAAREQFDMLLQLNYNHTAARYQRVLALIELGEWGPAEEEIRSLLESSPGNASYQRTLKKIQDSRLQGP